MCSTAGTALMFEWLNREERGLVERRLPRDAPSRRLIAVTEAARGGALWLVAAAALALRPGLCRVGARDAAIAVAAASGLANLTRRLLVRRRPAARDLPAHKALAHKPTSPSFPSAHAAVAAAFTTALARRTGPAGLAAAPLAAAVAYSRVRTRAHWPTDVAVGVAEGVFVGEVVHRAMTRNRP